MAHVKRKPRVCCLMNILPLYRQSIFSAIDQDNDMDTFFYGGDGSNDGIALMDGRSLSGFMGYMRNQYKDKKLIWQKGWHKVLFKGYSVFILTGNPGIRSNWLVMLYARLTGKKVVLWTHGLYGNESPLTKWKNMLYMRTASHLLLYGNHAKRLLSQSGYPSSKMSVVYNSLNNDYLKSLRKKYVDPSYMRNVFGNDYPVVIFTGRLTKHKSLELIIEAIGVLKHQLTGCNVMFVGEGEARAELEELAQKIGVDDRIFFYGECYDEQMLAVLFQNSRLCISPGNVGLTAIHSMSFGVPVISHDDFSHQMPEAETIRKGVTGSFFRRGDSISLAETMDRWLAITADKQKREKVEQNCYNMVDKVYNAQNQLKVIRHVVHSIV